MVKIPRCLVRYTHVAFHLFCGDAFLCIADDRNGQHPFAQRKMGIAEDRSRGGGELVLAESALIEEPIWSRPGSAIGICFHRALEDELGDLVEVAAEAANAIRPAGRFQVGVAIFFAREDLCGFYEIGADAMRFACHA